MIIRIAFTVLLFLSYFGEFNLPRKSCKISDWDMFEAILVSYEGIFTVFFLRKQRFALFDAKDVLFFCTKRYWHWPTSIQRLL